MQAVRPLRSSAARQFRSLHTTQRPSVARNPQRAFRQHNRRCASTESSPAASGGGSGALAGGVAGAVTTIVVGYTWYRWSGTKTVVDYVNSGKSHLDNAFKAATDNAPKPNEAVEWLRQTVTGYTKFVPGANQYVDQAFKDVEKVQEKHGDEVNKIVSDTYEELKGVTKAGASLAAASQAWTVLEKAFKRIGELAGDAVEDVLNEHPEVKDKVGARYKQLRQMADQYGPEAKKQVDDTVNQVKDIFKTGFSSDNIEKVRKLVDEKSQELRKFGDQAWQEGLKQAQPILEKYPELKKQIDENKDKLLQGGSLSQLWGKIQEVGKSGKTDDVKKFVEEQVSSAQESLGGSGGGSGGIEQFLKIFHEGGGKDVQEKFQQLQELSQKHGQEAEKLIKSAFEDIKKVLEEKVQEGKSLKDKAQDDLNKGK